ncbi:MAG: ImmA/IrrE family metallo-endopeptidase [Verrucomicrobiales bacterium]|nr:ImmA/IrrE family metallo-endopeptidase [Verrucomicrobiales bacterium]
MKSDLGRLTADSVKESLDELIGNAHAYRSGPEVRELFNFVRKFPHLAPFNAMLVHIQNRGARFVLRASEWRNRYGRRLRPGAQPYIILWPMSPIQFVFDLSDTEPIDPGWDEIPDLAKNPFPAKGSVPLKVMRRMHENAPRRRIRIEYADGGTALAGEVIRRSEPGIDFVVKLNSKHCETQRFGTLAHELAHVFCGHLGITDEKLWANRGKLTQETEEFEAEAVAYLVCERFHVDTGSAAYLSSYLSKDAPLPDFSLEAILRATHLVEEMASGRVRVRKKEAPGPRRKPSKNQSDPFSL